MLLLNLCLPCGLVPRTLSVFVSNGRQNLPQSSIPITVVFPKALPN